jgi:large subunit ribosomal protein L24
MHLLTIALLQVNITMPGYFVGFSGMEEAAAVPQRVSIGSIRLVHPIKDEETGITKDAIIRELKPIKMAFDRVTRTMTWSRMVPGLNVTIPWPKVEAPAEEDLPCDTPRIHVEEQSFIPTLLRPPMPETLIDELRNRYSAFRTRHTEEYIAQKEAEEAEKRALKDKAREMLTPVQELNRLERERRRARGQPVLTEEMLANIGEVMAKNLNGRKVKKSELSIPAETKTVAEEVQPPS